MPYKLIPVKVDTIHNKKLNVSVPAGSNSGTTFSIHEQGLPDHRTRTIGKLYIRVNGVAPRVDNEKIRERLRKIQNEINKSS